MPDLNEIYTEALSKLSSSTLDAEAQKAIAYAIMKAIEMYHEQITRGK